MYRNTRDRVCPCLHHPQHNHKNSPRAPIFHMHMPILSTLIFVTDHTQHSLSSKLSTSSGGIFCSGWNVDLVLSRVLTPCRLNLSFRFTSFLFLSLGSFLCFLFCVVRLVGVAKLGATRYFAIVELVIWTTKNRNKRDFWTGKRRSNVVCNCTEWIYI